MKKPMLFPPKKQFTKKYVTKYGILSLRYDQASIEEMDFFFDKIVGKKGQVIPFLHEFIKSNGKVEVTGPFWRRMIPKLRKRRESLICDVIMHGSNFVADLRETRYKSSPSLYHEVDTSKANKYNRKGIQGSNITGICKEWGIPGPKHLIENYTYEQYTYMMDRVAFNAFEGDKKTWGINDVMRSKMGLSKEDGDMLAIIKKQKEKGFIKAKNNGSHGGTKSGTGSGHE